MKTKAVVDIPVIKMADWYDAYKEESVLELITVDSILCTIKGCVQELFMDIEENHYLKITKDFATDLQTASKRQESLMPAVGKELITQYLEDLQAVASGNFDEKAIIKKYSLPLNTFNVIGHYERTPNLQHFFKVMSFLNSLVFKAQNPEEFSAGLFLSHVIASEEEVYQKWKQLFDFAAAVGRPNRIHPIAILDLSAKKSYNPDFKLSDSTKTTLLSNGEVNKFVEKAINNPGKTFAAAEDMRKYVEDNIRAIIGDKTNVGNVPPGITLLPKRFTLAAGITQNLSDTKGEKYVMMDKTLEAIQDKDFLASFGEQSEHALLIEALSELLDEDYFKQNAMKTRTNITVAGAITQEMELTTLYRERPSFLGASPTNFYIEPAPKFYTKLEVYLKNIISHLGAAYEKAGRKPSTVAVKIKVNKRDVTINVWETLENITALVNSLTSYSSRTSPVNLSSNDKTFKLINKMLFSDQLGFNDPRVIADIYTFADRSTLLWACGYVHCLVVEEGGKSIVGPMFSFYEGKIQGLAPKNSEWHEKLDRKKLDTMEMPFKMDRMEADEYLGEGGGPGFSIGLYTIYNE